MTKYITIRSWIATKSIQSNRPTRWQKLLAWLKLKPLAKPLFWFEAHIVITMPHPLKVGDIILTQALGQYCVIDRLNRNNTSTRETFKISSMSPMQESLTELGQAAILCSCSEMDPNTQPYGGQIV